MNDRRPLPDSSRSREERANRRILIWTVMILAVVGAALLGVILLG